MADDRTEQRVSVKTIRIRLDLKSTVSETLIKPLSQISIKDKDQPLGRIFENICKILNWEKTIEQESDKLCTSSLSTGQVTGLLGNDAKL